MKQKKYFPGKSNTFAAKMLQIAKMSENRNIQKASERDTPQIYAALLLALHRKYKFGHDRLTAVMEESQKIWCSEYGSDVEGMFKALEEETGITLKYGNE